MEGEARKYKFSVCEGVGGCSHSKAAEVKRGAQTAEAAAWASGHLEQVPGLLCRVQIVAPTSDTGCEGYMREMLRNTWSRVNAHVALRTSLEAGLELEKLPGGDQSRGWRGGSHSPLCIKEVRQENRMVQSMLWSLTDASLGKSLNFSNPQFPHLENGNQHDSAGFLTGFHGVTWSITISSMQHEAKSKRSANTSYGCHHHHHSSYIIVINISIQGLRSPL